MSTITINPPTMFVSDPEQQSYSSPEFDAVLEILKSDDIDEEDLQQLCTSFKPIEAEDILTANFILSTLLKYIHELDNRSLFSILIAYNFDRPARQFEMDLAVVVTKRAQSLLTEISSWDIHVLKQKVYLLPSIHTDAGTILTMIVLRIVKSYAILESKLLMVISRSTLIKIHFELSELLVKSDNNTNDNGLVKAYIGFVKQLIAEMESSPLESAQETYQISQDLQSMFEKFSSSHNNNQYSQSSDNGLDDSILLDSPQRLSTNPQQFGWQDSHYTLKGNKNHNRSFSLASSFDDLSSSVSTTSIAAEMPNIMQVFEIAKQEESNLIAMQNQQQQPATSPSRSRSTNTTSRRTRRQRRSSPSSIRSWNSTSSNRRVSGPLALPTITGENHQPYPSSPLSASFRMTRTGSKPVLKDTTATTSTPSSNESTLNVKKVGDRVMVQVGKDLVDMQEWLNKANTTPIKVMPSFLKTAQAEPTTTTTNTTTTTTKSTTRPPTTTKSPNHTIIPSAASSTATPSPATASWLNSLLGNAEKEFASSMGM